MMLGPPSASRACDVITLPAHLRDPGAEGVDRTPPVLSSSPRVLVRRGAEAATEESNTVGCDGGPVTSTSSSSASSCATFASILIRPVVKDDRTAVDEMGWRFRLVTGKPPTRLSIPSHTVRSLGGGLYLDWVDLPESPTGSFAFVVELVAVDGGGNSSNPIQVAISDEVGGLPGGCDGLTDCALGGASPARPGTTAFGALVLGLLAALSWRRRPARPRPRGGAAGARAGVASGPPETRARG